MIGSGKGAKKERYEEGIESGKDRQNGVARGVRGLEVYDRGSEDGILEQCGSGGSLMRFVSLAQVRTTTACRCPYRRRYYRRRGSLRLLGISFRIP